MQAFIPYFVTSAKSHAEAQTDHSYAKSLFVYIRGLVEWAIHHLNTGMHAICHPFLWVGVT